MSIYERNKCSVSGCDRLQRIKGRVRGRIYYGSKCAKCQRNRTFKDKEAGYTLKGIANPRCERCGWAEGPCDRHKINPILGYVKDNIEILCPNCHRLETLGIPNKYNLDGEQH